MRTSSARSDSPASMAHSYASQPSDLNWNLLWDTALRMLRTKRAVSGISRFCGDATPRPAAWRGRGRYRSRHPWHSPGPRHSPAAASSVRTSRPHRPPNGSRRSPGSGSAAGRRGPRRSRPAGTRPCSPRCRRRRQPSPRNCPRQQLGDEAGLLKGRVTIADTCKGLSRSRKCARQWMCSGRSGTARLCSPLGSTIQLKCWTAS